MKYVLKISCLFLVAAVLTGFSVTDEKAEQILKSSKAKIESLKDFSAKVKYEVSSPTMRNSFVKEGSFKYKQGNKFVVALSDEEYYCDGKTLWHYIPADAEVFEQEFDPEEGGSLEAIFDVYQANTEARYVGMESVHKVPCHKIFLVVKDPSLEYNQAYIWVNTKTKLLEKVVQIDRKQTKTTYEFSGIRANTGLSDTDFRFNPKAHPGVQIYRD
ncbi:MAG: outer membrane lipoprotein carrier protein LolA [Bacteroidota bacterium]